MGLINKKTTFVILILAFVVMHATPSNAACLKLKKRYQMTITTVFSGNVSSSAPSSCSYSLRKTRNLGKNRYIYSGYDCNGILYDVGITKACNNLSVSFPIAVAGLSVDSFGGVYVEQSTATLTCNGNLQAGKSIYANCSGTKTLAVGGSPFVITGSLSGYRTVDENMLISLSRLEGLEQTCNSYSTNENIAINCSDENNATGLALRSVVGD